MNAILLPRNWTRIHVDEYLNELFKESAQAMGRYAGLLSLIDGVKESYVAEVLALEGIKFKDDCVIVPPGDAKAQRGVYCGCDHGDILFLRSAANGRLAKDCTRYDFSTAEIMKTCPKKKGQKKPKERTA